MSSENAQQAQSAAFDMIDAAALVALGEKGKADNTVVRTAKCRTVAEGKKFRHLNYVRDLPPHIVDEDRKSTRLNSSHSQQSRMPSSA